MPRFTVRTSEITVSGRSPAAVVAKLRALQWNAPDRKRAYMEEVADRVEQMTGTTINTLDCATFLRDLALLNLLTIVEDGTPPDPTAPFPPRPGSDALHEASEN